MIERLRTACRDDLRVIAATLYGSFATGEADAYSDIEAALYFVPEALATLDRQAWVAQIAPVELFFADDFGHYTAIFANLVRGEFHFNAADRIPEVAGWRNSAWFPSAEAAVLVDRTGELTRQIDGLEHAPPDRGTPEMAPGWRPTSPMVCCSGRRCWRGVRRHAPLRCWCSLCAISSGWPGWSKETSRTGRRPRAGGTRPVSEAQARLMDCTARLDRAELARAYRNAWAWGRSLAETLAQPHGLVLPDALYDRISQRVNALQEELEWQ